MKKLTILSVCMALLFCLSFTTPAVASDEDDVMKVATTWYTAITTNNLELLSSLWWHSPKASTFEPGDVPFLIKGWDNIQRLWNERFSGSTGGTSSSTFLQPEVTMLGKDFAFATIYHVSVSTDQKTNESATSIVRESLFIQRIDGKWLIVHHHASYIPTE